MAEAAAAAVRGDLDKRENNDAAHVVLLNWLNGRIQRQIDNRQGAVIFQDIPNLDGDQV